jgi:two-component system response regulator YesN
MNKVLIVEDEAGLRNGIANAFSWAEMGCELYALAGTGIEALEICLTNQPDIIISDIVMPGIDGLSLLKYIKDKYPAIHFIIVTGHRNFEYAKNALNLGAEFFILKPIDYDELKAAIQKLSVEIIRKNEEKQMENERERILRDVLSGHIILKGALSPQGQKILDDLRFFRVCAIKFDDENNDDYFRNLQLMTFYQNLIKPSNVILARADNSCVVIILVLPDINDDLTDAQVYFTQLQEKTYEFFHVSVSIGISSSSGIFSITILSLSRSPNSSISLHTKSVCCGIIAIVKPPLCLVFFWFFQLSLYTTMERVSRFFMPFYNLGVIS